MRLDSRDDRLPSLSFRLSAIRERTFDTKLDRTDPLHDEADKLPLHPTEADAPPQLCADATGPGSSHAQKTTRAMTAKRIETLRMINLQLKRVRQKLTLGENLVAVTWR